MGLSFGLLSFEEQLHEIITGLRFGVSGTLHLMGDFIPWIYQDPEFVYCARFENLVGQEGGGSRQNQLEELKKIAEFLKIDMAEDQIEKRSRDLFGKPGEGTFRSGQIGDWKKHFNEEHKEAFKAVFGHRLIELGYEENLSW